MQGIVWTFVLIKGCLGLDDELDMLLKPKDVMVDENLYNHDVGVKYTTMAFSYFNDQFMNQLNEFSYREQCLNHYIRCLLTLTAPMPVCAFNNPFDREYGFYSVKSYCEIYFENCRRGNRIWRSLDHGECKFWYLTTWDHVAETRKSSNPLIYKILKVLASPPGNFDDTLIKIASNEWLTTLPMSDEWVTEKTKSDAQNGTISNESKSLPVSNKWVKEETSIQVQNGTYGVNNDNTFAEDLLLILATRIGMSNALKSNVSNLVSDPVMDIDSQEMVEEYDNDNLYVR